MPIVIQGGHILDPGRFNAVGDLVIDQGKIIAIGEGVKVPAGASDLPGQGPTGGSWIRGPSCAFS